MPRSYGTVFRYGTKLTLDEGTGLNPILLSAFPTVSLLRRLQKSSVRRRLCSGTALPSPPLALPRYRGTHRSHGAERGTRPPARHSPTPPGTAQLPAPGGRRGHPAAVREPRRPRPANRPSQLRGAPAGGEAPRRVTCHEAAARPPPAPKAAPGTPPAAGGAARSSRPARGGGNGSALPQPRPRSVTRGGSLGHRASLPSPAEGSGALAPRRRPFHSTFPLAPPPAGAGTPPRVAQRCRLAPSEHRGQQTTAAI